MLLRECERCKRIDREFIAGQPLCEQCRSVDATAKAEAFIAMREEFGRHVSAQVQIVSLCRYLRDKKRDEWVESFGSDGDTMLAEALAAVDGR